MGEEDFDGIGGGDDDTSTMKCIWAKCVWATWLMVGMVLLAGGAAAQGSLATPRVFVVTVWPGEAAYEKFGHNFLLVRDGSGALSGKFGGPAEPFDYGFNWGVFDFNQKNFYVNFIQGRMKYRFEVETAAAAVEAYRQQNRRILLQELNLSEEQTSRLVQVLAENLRPENREYRYDYFRDNCSTRLRDALDKALDGKLRSAMEGAPAGDRSIRWRINRYTADTLWLHMVLNFMLGPSVDKPLDAWGSTFIPMELAESIAAIDGVVKAQGELGPTLAQSITPELADANYSRTPKLAYAMAMIALLLPVLLTSYIRRLKWLMVWIEGLYVGLLTLAWLVLVWAALFTDHADARWNAHLFLPLIPLVMLSVAKLLRRTRLGRRDIVLSAAIAGVGASVPGALSAQPALTAAVLAGCLGSISRRLLAKPGADSRQSVIS